MPLLIAAVALLGVGYFALDKFVLSRHSGASLPGASAQSAIPEQSIAVLPFVNMSSDKEQDYFSDGLTEEMIDLLGQVPDLRVPARTSSFYFKGKNEPISNIAQQLKVAHVLEGSVRKSGNTIRVTTQLIRADSGYHLWSSTYDRDVKDIFKVQDEIAAAVVAALKMQLLPTQEVLNQHRTANTQAYEQYLLGRQSLNRGTDEGLQRAVTALQRAIALDPNYATAYAWLAVALSFMNADAEAIVAASRAVALAPGLAEAYAARGYVRWRIQWDWSGARADLEKALQLDPRDSTSRRRYAGLLLALGELPEATAAVQTAIKLDPLDGPNWIVLSRCLSATGDYVAAHRAVTRLLEISPEYSRWELAMIELLEGQTVEAQRIAKQQSYASLVAMAEHTLGHAKESQQALDEWITKYGKDSPTSVAEVYAWRAEADKAFEWLERAYRQRDQDLSYLKVDPLLAHLRGDPRYKALLRKMNLPE